MWLPGGPIWTILELVSTSLGVIQYLGFYYYYYNCYHFINNILLHLCHPRPNKVSPVAPVPTQRAPATNSLPGSKQVRNKCKFLCSCASVSAKRWAFLRTLDTSRTFRKRTADGDTVKQTIETLCFCCENSTDPILFTIDWVTAVTFLLQQLFKTYFCHCLHKRTLSKNNVLSPSDHCLTCLQSLDYSWYAGMVTRSQVEDILRENNKVRWCFSVSLIHLKQNDKHTHTNKCYVETV